VLADRKKRTFYSEWAYVLGVLTLAIGTALMERADFGMSMVVAPAYLIHLKVSQYLPWYSFGISEYFFQAFLIIVLSIVLRRMKLGYLFSFVTAVIYGTILDLSMTAIGYLSFSGILARVVFFVVGILFCSMGVSFLFHTYISPEAYELVVKEVTSKYKKNITKVKTIYDCTSCLVGILLSFLFFGLWHFQGVNVGTVITAIVNGWLIGRFGKFWESHYNFRDGLKWRQFFEK